tara:strand:- start:5378 stop:6436 length:1059 start_codon:yes stop_codon:yes gene_type:complete
MKNKDKIYVWACDVNDYRGEGILAINFLKQLNEVSKKEIFVESPHAILIINNGKIKIITKEYKKKINFNFLYNYLFPLMGIIKIYINRSNYSKICYVNFLPLWNFLLFLLLPKDTIYGPVTGSVYNGKVDSINSFLRKYLIPILYNFSLKIIGKKKYLLFSTSLLKKFITPSSSKNYFFDYNLINYKKNSFSLVKKDIDLLFYYRKYAAHDSSKQARIIERLAMNGYKIFVVGDNIKMKNVTNLGIISRKKVFEYLRRSKFTINEATNFFSIFCIDSISCGTQVFFDKNIARQQHYFPKKYFIKINLDDANFSYLMIKKALMNYHKVNKLNFSLVNFKKKYLKYFTSQVFYN